ncbi:MFS transporter [Rhodococcus opacus]|uniref:MFS transporter n=1 Tax=Rhodococcus opacus TaxID=37919 RepID=A0AAX3YTM4_RHOOP|nr:MFS transporter [Rhodococcus opacus]MCZ4587584.1 MFS transporter [Rhodococcus opacus]WLF51414.1 MFS transporter [Rhodococcus opacus]
MEILDRIRNSRMTRFQYVAIGIALALIVVDGIDVAIMSYAAPYVSRQWNVAPVNLGLLLSASLFGMAAGSIVLTPLADRFGRRKVTLVALSIAVVGLALSPLASTATELMYFRILTGVGVGGMMANLIVLSSEYSSDKRRGTVVGIIAAGYPIGAGLGGLLASVLLPRFGWPSLFVSAAVLSALLLALSIRMLPESLDFLLANRPPKALQSVNAILAKMNVEPVSALPPAESSRASKSAVREILTRPVRFRALALWLGYACLIGAYYFVNTWTPKMIASASNDDSLGVTVAFVANVGGIVGALALSALSLRFRIQRTLVLALVLSAVSYVVFGMVFESVSGGLYAAFLLGLITTGAVAGFYVYAPGIYTARARATGMGWTMGIGRMMSILAPILVGFLIDGGLQPQTIFFVFAIPLLVSAACVFAIEASLRKAVRSSGSIGTARPAADAAPTVKI